MTAKNQEMDRKAARLLELQWKIDHDLHSEDDKAELNLLEADRELLSWSTSFAEEFHKKYHQKQLDRFEYGDSRTDGEANMDMIVDIVTVIALAVLLIYSLGIAMKALG